MLNAEKCIKYEAKFSPITTKVAGTLNELKLCRQMMI
tara:strand:- start:254 stop:364 length:111 start_codon:yes stop_codon:yes gene_type:complete